MRGENALIVNYDKFGATDTTRVVIEGWVMIINID